IFVQATASQGTYDPATGVWNVGTLASGVTATIQITVRMNTLGPVVNAASVFADDFDPDLSNNRGTAGLTGMETGGMISKRDFLASRIDPPVTDFARALGMQLTAALTPGITVVGEDGGDGSQVRVFAANGNLLANFAAFNSNFRGGVRTAVGDVNGDGIPDVIVAAGPGGGPNLRVFNGKTGLPLTGPLGDFMAYDLNFAGGVYVAAADVNH